MFDSETLALLRQKGGTSTLTDATDEEVVAAILAASREIDMTPEQIVEYVIEGEVRHPDAPEDRCGVTNPADKSQYCQRSVRHRDHGGTSSNHNAQPVQALMMDMMEAANGLGI